MRWSFKQTVPEFNNMDVLKARQPLEGFFNLNIKDRKKYPSD